MEYEFKPKEWVLTRDNDDDEWTLNIFSHMHGEYYYCVSTMWLQCIPYKGNEALLGKSDAPAEWKVGDKVEMEYDTNKKWYGGEIVRIDLSKRSWDDGEAIPYYVRSECFKYNDGCAWCAARQLRKPREFKFGDKVEWRDLDDGEWHEGLIIETDHSDIPYKVAATNGDVHWRRREDVRHAG